MTPFEQAALVAIPFALIGGFLGLWSLLVGALNRSIMETDR